MSLSFEELGKELGFWKHAGVLPRFWWRDDDGHASTPALGRAIEWSNSNCVSGLLSAIPAKLDHSLAEVLEEAPLLWVAQHGWSHTNHVAAPGNPSELGRDRPLQDVAAELSRGDQILSKAFAKRYLPVVVPPWNRLSPEIAARLPSLGYAGLSSHWGLHRSDSPPELNYFDTHVDASEKANGHWTGASGPAILSSLVRALQSVRTSGRHEPIGILTHHLFMDDNRTWDVLARIVEATRANGGLWMGPPDLFVTGSGSPLASSSPISQQRERPLVLDEIGEAVNVVSQMTCKATFSPAGRSRGTFVDRVISLHPARIGDVSPSVEIEMTLDGHDLFCAQIGIEGTRSESVEFDFEIKDATKDSRQRIVAHCEVGSRMLVRLLQPIEKACRLTLMTRMAKGAKSNDYAWAFVSDIMFARSLKSEALSQ